MNLRQFLRLPKTPAGRIAFAIALSLLIHASLLVGPVAIPPIEAPPPPPLIAKLEPLPVVRHQPAAHAKHAKKPVKPEAAASQTTPTESSLVPDLASASEVIPVDAPPEPPAEEARPAHPLPKRAQLTFIVYKGTGFAVGEARHKLSIDENNHYTLEVGMNTTGIASLFKTFEMNQQSIGTTGAEGLRPTQFSEIRVTSKGRQTLQADFDWQNSQLAFSSGNSTALPEQTQDILSFLYQFSQMPLDSETLPMHVSNGRKLESYRLEIGTEEVIDTRLGKLRALPLRKIHAPGEEGLEIWLGLEYRLLPVQIRQIDRNGEIAGQMVVSDIRVSEEQN